MTQKMDEGLKKELLQGLQDDLRGEMTAIHYYLYCASVVEGLARLKLKPLFLQEANEEIAHAQYLAEKISILGGEPIMAADTFEATRQTRKMLEEIKKAEETTIQRYIQRVKQAEQLDLWELKIHLEELIAEETHHLEETLRLLQDPHI